MNTWLFTKIKFLSKISFSFFFSVFRPKMLAEEFGSDTDDDDYIPEGTNSAIFHWNLSLVFIKDIFLKNKPLRLFFRDWFISYDNFHWFLLNFHWNSVYILIT